LAGHRQTRYGEIAAGLYKRLRWSLRRSIHYAHPILYILSIDVKSLRLPAARV